MFTEKYPDNLFGHWSVSNLPNITESVSFTMKIVLFIVTVSSLKAFWLPFPSYPPLDVAYPHPPMLGRTLHSPTIIPSPYSAQEASSLVRPRPGDIGCEVTSQGSGPFYLCRGVKVQKLDVLKTPYGWRVPFLGNGVGHAVRVYVPNVRHGIIQTV